MDHTILAPDCRFFNFDDSGKCYVSPTCAGHHEPEGLQSDSLDSLGVYQLFCSMLDSADKNCAGDALKLVSVSHLTSCSDECDASGECEMFAFNSRENGCALFDADACAQYSDSPGSRIYFKHIKDRR
jgi:hypothetical protein